MHGLLVYETEAELLATTIPFVREGIEAGESVLVVAAPAHLRALEREVAPDPALELVEATAWHASGREALARRLAFVDGAAARGRPGVRVLEEVATPRPELEAAANLVRPPLPLATLCAYDARRLPDDVVDGALATHPQLVEHGRVVANPRFGVPEADGKALLDVPPDAHELRVAPDGIAAAAAVVETRARAAGVAEPQVQRLLGAVSEVVLNGLVHGTGTVRLATWVDGGRLHCQLEDDGAGGVRDPAYGLLPPRAGRPDGWGLWLARQRSDSFALGRGRRGTAVRLGVVATRDRPLRPRRRIRPHQTASFQR